MTIEEAIEQMNIFEKNYDNEEAHIAADELLCDILIQLGWKKLVDEYYKIGKWYS